METREEMQEASLRELPLWKLAEVVRKDWKHLSYAALPYLEAMASLATLRGMYGADDGRSIVLYFLSNAGSWRGEVARTVKQELRRRLQEGEEEK